MCTSKIMIGITCEITCCHPCSAQLLSILIREGSGIRRIFRHPKSDICSHGAWSIINCCSIFALFDYILLPCLLLFGHEEAGIKTVWYFSLYQVDEYRRNRRNQNFHHQPILQSCVPSTKFVVYYYAGPFRGRCLHSLQLAPTVLVIVKGELVSR